MAGFVRAEQHRVKVRFSKSEKLGKQESTVGCNVSRPNNLSSRYGFLDDCDQTTDRGEYRHREWLARFSDDLLVSAE